MTKLNDKTIQVLNITEMSFIFSVYSKDSKKIIDHSFEWDIFQPTKFMYLYQTFNMIYDLSWDLFKEDNNNNKFGFNKILNGSNRNSNEYDFSKENYGKYYGKNIEVHERISKLNKFCNDKSGRPYLHEKFSNLLFNEENKIIIEKFTDSKDEIRVFENQKNNRYYLASLKAIKESSLEEKWNNFQDGRFLTYNILIYLNYLRNNLFHGSKKINSLLSKSQIYRFEFYNKLLEIYIELFFSLMNEKYNYNRIKLSDLKEVLNT